MEVALPLAAAMHFGMASRGRPAACYKLTSSSWITEIRRGAHGEWMHVDDSSSKVLAPAPDAHASENSS